MQAPPESATLKNSDILRAMQALREGDFSTRLTGDYVGLDADVANTFNDVVSLNEKLMRQLQELGQDIGKNGMTERRCELPEATGDWHACIEIVNELIDDVVLPTIEVERVTKQLHDIAEVIADVANGELSKRISIGDVAGDIRVLEESVNRIIEQLGAYASKAKQADSGSIAEAKNSGGGQTNRADHELHAKLAHAQNFYALGHVTRGIAHEFGNMLMVTMSALQRVLGMGDLDENKTETLNRALEAARRCRDLIRRLRNYASVPDFSAETLDINDSIETLSTLLRHMEEESFEFILDLQGDLWPVRTDRVRLEMAIVSLVVSLHDAMPYGGRLTLRTRNITNDKTAGASGKANGPYVLFELAEAKSPSAKEGSEHILDSNHAMQTDGLDLSTLHAFVRRSGGELTVDHESGQGRTVQIQLPRCMEETADKGPMSGSEVPARLSGRKQIVLVVDDDVAVRSFTADLLRSIGLRVLEADDAQDALKLLKQEPEMRLMLTTVTLPGNLNGDRLADEARRLHPKIKILFTSAQTTQSEAKASSSKLKPLLRKPYLEHELESAVIALLH